MRSARLALVSERGALPRLTELLDADEGSDAGVVADGLRQLSGLPGPRANLEVLSAFAQSAPRDLVLALDVEPPPGTADPDRDEYVVACATAALGRLWADGLPDAEARLRHRATDASWRVREAVAIALQYLGDRDPDLLRRTVGEWSAGPDLLRARAAVAGICEPRLLVDADTAQAALDACEAATALIRALPAERRRDEDKRVLRQALGYCWSVAVSASPEPGLARFRALDTDDDADVAWIVRENRKKARLKRLLD